MKVKSNKQVTTHTYRMFLRDTYHRSKKCLSCTVLLTSHLTRRSRPMAWEALSPAVPHSAVWSEWCSLLRPLEAPQTSKSGLADRDPMNSAAKRQLQDFCTPSLMYGIFTTVAESAARNDQRTVGVFQLKREILDK